MTNYLKDDMAKVQSRDYLSNWPSFEPNCQDCSEPLQQAAATNASPPHSAPLLPPSLSYSHSKKEENNNAGVYRP